MKPGPPRVLLGERRTLLGYARLYRTADGLLNEELDTFTIRRQRIFWDDVLAVTLHRRTGLDGTAWLLGGTGLIAWFAFAVIGLTSSHAVLGLLLGLLGASPFWISAGLRARSGLAVGTVQGRRTTGGAEFWLRQRRARRLDDELPAETRRRPGELAEAPGLR